MVTRKCSALTVQFIIVQIHKRHKYKAPTAQPIAECDEKPISILETGTRIPFFQSHVRDENENLFFFSISGFETRTRIEIETILARIFENYIYRSFID